MSFLLRLFASKTAVLALLTFAAAVVTAATQVAVPEAQINAVAEVVLALVAALSSGVTLVKLASLVEPLGKVFQNATDGDPNT